MLKMKHGMFVWLILRNWKKPSFTNDGVLYVVGLQRIAVSWYTKVWKLTVICLSIVFKYFWRLFVGLCSFIWEVTEGGKSGREERWPAAKDSNPNRCDKDLVVYALPSELPGHPALSNSTILVLLKKRKMLLDRESHLSCFKLSVRTYFVKL